MTKADKFLILIVLFLGATSYLAMSFLKDTGVEKAQAVIKQEGKIVQSLPLEGDAQFTLQGKNGPFTVETQTGRIRIKESTCPDKYCVKRGWISTPGDTIICVPYEVIIYFDAESPLDAITG